jgi:hypothetical protein
MSKLGLSDWANLSEIAASIILVVSIIYVGLEINQNTIQLQNSSHLAVNQLLAETDMMAAANKEFHGVITKSTATPSEVSAEDFARFVSFVLPRLGIWEYMYLATKSEAVGSSTWEAFDPYFKSIICTAGYRRAWQENEQIYAGSFRTYLNDVVIPAECKSSVHVSR